MVVVVVVLGVGSCAGLWGGGGGAAGWEGWWVAVACVFRFSAVVCVCLPVCLPGLVNRFGHLIAVECVSHLFFWSFSWVLCLPARVLLDLANKQHHGHSVHYERPDRSDFRWAQHSGLRNPGELHHHRSGHRRRRSVAVREHHRVYFTPVGACAPEPSVLRAFFRKLLLLWWPPVLHCALLCLC